MTATAKKAPAKKRATVPAAEKTTAKTATAVDALTDIPTGVHEVSIDLIDPHPHNPRKDLGDLTELAQSIREHGVQQNLTLVPHPDDSGRFRIVIGHRRAAAAREVGLTTVPAAIRKWDPAEQLEIMLVENVQRRDLTVVEEAQGMFELFDTHKVSKAQIANRTGVSKKTVDTRIRLAQVDDVLKDRAVAQQLSIEDVLYIDEIRGMDASIYDETINQLRSTTDSSAHVIVTNARRRYSEQQRIDTTTQEWAEKGHTLIVGNADWQAVEDRRNPLVRLNQISLDADAHAGCPGAVVYCASWCLNNVDDYGVFYCTDAATHHPEAWNKYSNHDPAAAHEARIAAQNAEWEKTRAEQAERAEAFNTARRARTSFIIGHGVDDPKVMPIATQVIDRVLAGEEVILNWPAGLDAVELPQQPAMAALTTIIVCGVEHDVDWAIRDWRPGTVTAQDQLEDYEANAMDYLVALTGLGYEPTVEADALAAWRALPATAPDEPEAGDES